jgi:hypothetical protein
MAATAEASAGLNFPILMKYRETLTTFERLIRVAHYQPLLAWQDQLGRLRVFAGNVKVHRRLRNSLDFKLRDSSHLSTVVLKLLRRLSETLVEGHSSTVRLSSRRIKAETSLGISAYTRNESTTLRERTTNEVDSDALQDAFEEVVELIDNLYDLVPTLLAPASHDQLVDNLAPSIPQTMKDIDIHHVRDKFPNAPEALADQLGAANCQRRTWLAHNQARHAAKLKRLQESELQNTRNVDSTYGSRPTMSTHRSTVPSNIITDINDDPVEKEDCLDFEYGDTMNVLKQNGGGDSDSDVSGDSATSYNVTVSAKDPNGPIRVPKPPDEYYDKKPFECPYCCEFLPDVHTMNAWK